MGGQIPNVSCYRIVNSRTFRQDFGLILRPPPPLISTFCASKELDTSTSTLAPKLVLTILNKRIYMSSYKKSASIFGQNTIKVNVVSGLYCSYTKFHIFQLGHFGIYEFWTHPHHFCKYSLPGVLLVWRKKSENMNYSYSKGLHFLFYEHFCQMKGLEDTDVWSFSTSIF